jgi:hypothetical protein
MDPIPVRYPDATARQRAGVAEQAVRGRQLARRMVEALAALTTETGEGQAPATS